jgi:shikimate dehydrogenase
MSDHAYLVGLIGSGIGSSLTPALHEREAAELGLDYVYRTIDLAALGVAPEEVGELVSRARQLGFDALNITHPCKQLVVPHLDVVDSAVEQLGAANTVVFDGEVAFGHNTDVTGFATAVRRGLPGASLSRVVQIGAGGAGAAVGHALLGLGAEQLIVVDIDEQRSTALGEQLSRRFPDARVDASVPEKLSVHLDGASGLVHCTPTGMAAHPGLPLEAELIHEELWVADIVYRPLETALVRAARDAGCRVLDGGAMAVHQAVDTLALVTGLTPDADRMAAHFQALVGAEPVG